MDWYLQNTCYHVTRRRKTKLTHLNDEVLARVWLDTLNGRVSFRVSLLNPYYYYCFVFNPVVCWNSLVLGTHAGLQPEASVSGARRQGFARHRVEVPPHLSRYYYSSTNTLMIWFTFVWWLRYHLCTPLISTFQVLYSAFIFQFWVDVVAAPAASLNPSIWDFE